MLQSSTCSRPLMVGVRLMMSTRFSMDEMANWLVISLMVADGRVKGAEDGDGAVAEGVGMDGEGMVGAVIGGVVVDGAGVMMGGVL